MTTRDLIAAGLYLVPALLFTVIARQMWVFRRVRRPRSRAFRLMPIVTTALAAHYFILLAKSLIPGATPHDIMAVVRTPWNAAVEVSWLVTIALLAHLLRLLPLPERRPSAAWLLLDYGIAAGVAATSLTLRLRPGATPDQQEIGHHVFEIGFAVLGALCLVQFFRNARPGAWGPEHAGEVRGPDVVLVKIGIVTTFAIAPLVWLAGGEELANVAWEVVLGLAIAAPMAVRMLGWVLPELMVLTVLFAATAGVAGRLTFAIPRVDAAYHPLLGFGAIVTILAVFTGGQELLRALATRIVVRRSRRQAQDLQEFLHGLSPELGVVECVRRVLAELVRVRQIPGAAMIFRDREPVVVGDFRLDPVLSVWPRGAAIDALPAGSYGSSELRELPLALREALVEANVGLGAAAVDSPRRRWGHLFMNTGFFGGTFREDDAAAFKAFVDQLALLLAGAALLERTRAVERSLAHAEKLAAIGELAARFAHEIRNPVTAARSLAQQLARDPTSALNAEHAEIILVELERVEQQVRDLLRFSRREELRLDTVDLGALVRATAADFRARFAAAGIAAEVDTRDGVVARVDREKLRQVLVNLVENAVDALGNGAAEKRLRLGAVASDGSAVLRVTDNGSGIPADALVRIFEPFVSLKPSGTGLGLAIAKRTIDAHGGSIDVTSHPGATTFEIHLPLEATW